jgi:eukaryotic-like serine/threonine-protein kinase
MPLTAGSRLGTYEITVPLGAGGMGEVFRARDTKLGRQVAIKVLPESVESAPDRVARFEREAKALAALHHPHIATLFGMEQEGGKHFLVMELVEGETLDARIARGPTPVPEALAIARQIADALEAAHEAGIVHRDLKPANVKSTPDGVVKVLDFGLAKALDTAPGSQRDISLSPTMTSVNATGSGTILGTAAYMSPEQARGMPTDHRSDIFAFGAVFYELLTRRFRARR